MSSKCTWVLAFLVAAVACVAQTSPRGTVAGQAEKARIVELMKQFNAASQYCAGIERLQRSSEPIRFFSSQGQWYEGTPSKDDVADGVATYG